MVDSGYISIFAHALEHTSNCFFCAHSDWVVAHQQHRQQAISHIHHRCKYMTDGRWYGSILFFSGAKSPGHLVIGSSPLFHLLKAYFRVYTWYWHAKYVIASANTDSTFCHCWRPAHLEFNWISCTRRSVSTRNAWKIPFEKKPTQRKISEPDGIPAQKSWNHSRLHIFICYDHESQINYRERVPHPTV